MNRGLDCALDTEALVRDDWYLLLRSWVGGEHGEDDKWSGQKCHCLVRLFGQD